MPTPRSHMATCGLLPRGRSEEYARTHVEADRCRDCWFWTSSLTRQALVSLQYQGGRVMKVRFGFSCRGQADLTLDVFPQLVDDLERLGFDSLWLPEHMLNGPFDPLVSLAHAAARTTRLKLGAYLIVPGRNPVRLARELANLDRLSGGRLLLIMVL